MLAVLSVFVSVPVAAIVRPLLFSLVYFPAGRPDMWKNSQTAAVNDRFAGFFKLKASAPDYDKDNRGYPAPGGVFSGGFFSGGILPEAIA